MEKMAAIKIIRKIEMMTTHEQGNKCAVVLDTLQVSMHPDVGPDTSGTRTIKYVICELGPDSQF